MSETKSYERAMRNADTKDELKQQLEHAELELSRCTAGNNTPLVSYWSRQVDRLKRILRSGSFRELADDNHGATVPS